MKFVEKLPQSADGFEAVLPLHRSDRTVSADEAASGDGVVADQRQASARSVNGPWDGTSGRPDPNERARAARNAESDWRSESLRDPRNDRARSEPGCRKA